MELDLETNGEVIKKNGLFFKKIIGSLNKQKYHFESSHIYALVSKNCDNFALSYALTGLAELNNTIVQINRKVISEYELRRTSFYVGGGLDLSKKSTVRNEISYALDINNNSYTFKEIVDYFSLTQSRLDRLIKYTGNEHWRASLAIGYASGKTIFCFPFINKELSLELIRLKIDKFILKLQAEKKIIILPVESESELAELADVKYIL